MDQEQIQLRLVEKDQGIIEVEESIKSIVDYSHLFEKVGENTRPGRMLGEIK